MIEIAGHEGLSIGLAHRLMVVEVEKVGGGDEPQH